MRRVRVTIDAVALHGVPPVERAALAQELQRQLTQALRDPAATAGMRARHTSVVKLAAGAAGSGASGVAGRLARGIVEAVKK